MLKPEKIRAAVYGHLIGDALGVPYEFHNSYEIPPFNQIEMIPPENFNKSHPHVPCGYWSDDGAQMLVLLESLLRCGFYNEDDFAKGLVRWYDNGYMAVGNLFYGLGSTTKKAIKNLKDGVRPINAGPASEKDNGNGALMRILPLALLHTGSDEDLVKDAHSHSCVTHGHNRSKVCCALYCLWVRFTLLNEKEPWIKAVTTLMGIYSTWRNPYIEFNVFFEELALILSFRDVRGTGYVVDCLQSARFSSEQGGYEKAVKVAIALGSDCDTTACVTGGLVALRDGLDTIPQRWLDQLEGKEIVEEIFRTYGI